MNEEYNLGYFEGVRNAFMAWCRCSVSDPESILAFSTWIQEELADAKKLKEESTTCSCDGTIHHIDECAGDEE